jgi:hypothetical protein
VIAANFAKKRCRALFSLLISVRLYATRDPDGIDDVWIPVSTEWMSKHMCADVRVAI